MANSFEFKDSIDYAKLNKVAGTKDEILIGYPSGMAHYNPDGEASDMAEDAKKLSFGTDKYPARPFLEDGISDNIPAIQAAINQHYTNVVSGNGSDMGLWKIARIAIGGIQDFVKGDYYKSTAPNSEATIAKKSTRQKGKWLLSDTPLMDIGNMINGIVEIVNGKKGGK